MFQTIASDLIGDRTTDNKLFSEYNSDMQKIQKRKEVLLPYSDYAGAHETQKARAHARNKNNFCSLSLFCANISLPAETEAVLALMIILSIPPQDNS